MMDDTEEDDVIIEMDDEEKAKFFIIMNVLSTYEQTLLNNFGKIMHTINSFINYRSETLQSKNPGLRLLYTPGNENEFYDSCGIDKERFKEICKNSPVVPGDYLVNNPVKQFYHLYFLLHSVACVFYRNNDELIKKYYRGIKDPVPPYKTVEIYFTIRLYSIQQIRIFQHPPKEDVMEYTINNLNNRFDLASAPNLFSIFQKYSETNTKSMNFNWGAMTDEMMAEYTNKMNNRIKMFLKVMYREYIKNKNANLSSGVQELEATNDEGKQFLLVADNVSSTIDITSKKILNNFIQEKFINEKLLRIACRNSGNPSFSKAKMVIQTIKECKDEKLLTELIVCILSYWLISMKKDVNTLHSKEFIVTCSAAYAISNTSDKYIIRLKEILEELVTKYTDKIIDTERKATIISYKKCVHIYMVLYIASVN